MADNVTTQTALLATVPDATKIATDQLPTGEQVQYVKLMDGTPDGTTKGIIGSLGLNTDVGDRAGRLLGIVASIATAVQLAAGAALIGTVKLSDGVDTALVSAAGELSTDVSDRAGRALGVVASITSAVDVSDRVGRALGVVASITNPVAVTGTFWQATQPVSIAAAVDVSDRVGRALGVVASITATVTTDVTDRAARALGVVASITAPVKLFDGVDTALITTGGRLLVQPSYDGLTQVMFTAEAVAGIIAETAITLTKSQGFAATSTGTSFGPTAGKNLRILGLILTWVSTTTTANTARFRLRVNAGGAATTASPLQLSFRIGWESATFIANEAEVQPIFFDRPIEIPSGGQFMATIACVAANGTLDVTLICEEYTP